MSQNSEHTPRRALSPPAVTRFQLRTASATEAVFSPPYVPAPRDPRRPAPSQPVESVTSEPFTDPTAPALPPVARRELPRPAPPTRALELPPRRESEPVRPEADRTEPGTWREIIARFERELGPVTDAEQDAEAEEAAGEEIARETSPSAAPAGRWRAPFDIDEVESEEPAQAVEDQFTGASEQPTAAETEQPVTAAGPVQDEPPASPEPVQPLGPPTGAEPGLPGETPGAEPVQPLGPAGAEPVQPGEPPLLDDSVPWEIGAMTTPDYSPPHSIHDAEHDSWPVDTDDGEAVPAWSEDVDDAADEQDADVFGEIGELLLDQVAPADPWDTEPEPEQEPQARSEFPLDAFIVPAGVQNVGGYRDDDVAHRVAHRLDELARQLRDGGFSSLGTTATVDELSRVLAAVVTGYVARGG